MQTTCSSPNGVDVTQRMVVNALYANKRFDSFRQVSAIKKNANLTWSSSSPLQGIDLGSSAFSQTGEDSLMLLLSVRSDADRRKVNLLIICFNE
jgi:hypothetical protein